MEKCKRETPTDTRDKSNALLLANFTCWLTLATFRQRDAGISTEMKE